MRSRWGRGASESWRQGDSVFARVISRKLKGHGRRRRRRRRGRPYKLLRLSPRREIKADAPSGMWKQVRFGTTSCYVTSPYPTTCLQFAVNSGIDEKRPRQQLIRHVLLEDYTVVTFYFPCGVAHSLFQYLTFDCSPSSSRLKLEGTFAVIIIFIYASGGTIWKFLRILF